MNKPFSNAAIRKLKALAQHLEPVLRVGREGVSDAFVKSVDEALEAHELIKIRFAACKDEKRELAPLIAGKTSSFPVARVGNVLVLFRVQPDPAKRKIKPDE